jgi:hypothetical protein
MKFVTGKLKTSLARHQGSTKGARAEKVKALAPLAPAYSKIS